MSRIHFLLFLLSLSFALPLRAETVYQAPKEFLAEVFHGEVPKASALFVSGDTRRVATEILGHPPGRLRVRYWLRENRSAWILEEIGKTKPITTGIVIDDGSISDLRVLIYRESHGGEVRHGFFTEQFIGGQLDAERKLDVAVDGIAGATLSVSAMKRLSRLALYLNSQIQQ